MRKRVTSSQLNLKNPVDFRNPAATWEFLSQIGVATADPPEIKNYNFVNRMLTGETLIIIGSGFSGRGVDWSKLRKTRFKTLAVNHVIEHFQADYLIFQDHRFMKRTKFDLKSFSGMTFCANNNPFALKAGIKKLVRFRPIKGNQISRTIEQGLFHRVSTGLCALNLGVIMNAKKIYMIGCDSPREWKSYDPEKGTHIYPGYTGEVNTSEAIEGYIKSLKLYRHFQPHSSKIVNVCKGGLIPYFQQISVERFNEIITTN